MVPYGGTTMFLKLRCAKPRLYNAYENKTSKNTNPQWVSQGTSPFTIHINSTRGPMEGSFSCTEDICARHHCLSPGLQLCHILRWMDVVEDSTNPWSLNYCSPSNSRWWNISITQSQDWAIGYPKSSFEETEQLKQHVSWFQVMLE